MANMFGTECIMTLQGHPRSLILIPIENAYVNSYWSLIVILILSYRVSEIIEPLSFLPHPSSSQNSEGVPVGSMTLRSAENEHPS